MSRAWLMLFALCALPGTGMAHPAPDVLGLRLGMTDAEAVSVLQARHLKAHATYRPCLDEYLAQRRNVVSIAGRGRCLQVLNARYAGGDVLVFLSEDLPDHAGRTRVDEIALNYVADSAVSEVMRKAGEPALTDGKRPWTVAMWCFDFKCTNMDQTLNRRRAGSWLLVHRGAGLTLADNRLDSEPLLVDMLSKRGVTLEP